MSRTALIASPDTMSPGTGPRGLPLVLVVDDRAEVRTLIARMVEPADFDVVEAANGEEALNLLAAGVVPRVIVLDLWMPIVDGWEFLERSTTSAPVIIISGVEEELSDPLPARVVRFLKKPIAREDLMTAVRHAERRACGQ